MTLELYCKQRIRELLDQLDDTINDHAHTAYLETEADYARWRVCVM